MESIPSIQSFLTLLKSSIKEEFVISNVTICKLPVAGESYNSQLLALDVNIHKLKLNQKETLHLIAKIPTDNEEIKKLFGSLEMFRREAAFYNTMLPALQEFQKEQGVTDIMDFFPKCYGARINLTSLSNEVDDHAIVLLEDLRFSEFLEFARFHEFDLKVAEVFLKNLATFHAVSVAMKLLKPYAFKEKMLPYLSRNKSFDHFTETTARAEIDFILTTAKLKEECLPFLFDIEQSLISSFRLIEDRTAQREPFATISHNDLWVNNIMMRYGARGQTQTKLLDFQLMDYGSPGIDITFFLLTSVKMDILRQHYDNLILLYYNTFVGKLKRLNCDTLPFTFNLLQEEIRLSAKKQFFRTIMILRYLLATKEAFDKSIDKSLFCVSASSEYKKRAPEVLIEYINRKWL